MATDIIGLLKDLKLDPSKLQELAVVAQQSPFAAMAKVQELGISLSDLQRIMKAVMENPTAFFDAAKSMGIPDEMLASAKERLKSFS